MRMHSRTYSARTNTKGRSASAIRLSSPLAGIGVLAAGLAAPLFMAIAPAHAAGTQLYLSPAAATVAQGSTFAVAVRITTDEAINAVQANFTYPSGQVEFVGINATDSSFKTEAPSFGGGGNVSIARGQIGGVKGDALLATVTFKALAGSGSAKMEFSAGTEAMRDSNNTNALSGTTGATCSFKAAVTGGAAPTAKPSPSAASGNPTTPSASPDPTVSADQKGPQASEKPTVTTNSKNSTIQPLDKNKAVNDQPIATKTVVWGVSGMLIIAAAAVIGTMYFRKRHAVGLAPAAVGMTAMGGPAGPVDFGPPTNQFDQLPPTSPFSPSSAAPLAPPAQSPAAPLPGQPASASSNSTGTADMADSADMAAMLAALPAMDVGSGPSPDAPTPAAVENSPLPSPASPVTPVVGNPVTSEVAIQPEPLVIAPTETKEPSNPIAVQPAAADPLPSLADHDANHSLVTPSQPVPHGTVITPTSRPE